MRLPADDDRQTLILDVEALSEISPDFVRFLVGLRKYADGAHYQIHLVGVSVRLKRTLEKTGLILNPMAHSVSASNAFHLVVPSEDIL